MYDDGYMTVNDALGHAAVLRVLDRAIEMAEGGVMADEERICLNCRNGTPDKLEHRTIVCNVLPRILDMPVDCMQYCYGGSVREVECPADFGCNHWTLHPKPEG